MYYLGSPESDFGYERILRAEEQDLSSFGRGARMRARLRRASPRTQRRRRERARSAAQRRAQLRVARRAATSQTNLEQSRRVAGATTSCCAGPVAAAGPRHGRGGELGGGPNLSQPVHTAVAALQLVSLNQD